MKRPALLVENRDAQHLGAAIAVTVVDVRNGLHHLRRVHRPGALAFHLGSSLDMKVGGVLLDHGGEVPGHHAVRVAQLDHAAAVQPESPVADGFHVGHRVRNEQDGDAARAHLVNLAHAALAKIDVADGQGLVHQQNFRVHIDSHSEGQPHHHAARISLDRLVDEVANLGEGFDVLVALVDLPGGQAKNGAVEVDVVASGEFRVESRAQFEQRRDAPIHRDGSRTGMEYPGHHLEQRALARTILPDDAEGFAAPHLEGDIVQRPEVPVTFDAIQGHQFPEPVARSVVDRVALGNTLKLDGVHGCRRKDQCNGKPAGGGMCGKRQKGRPPTPPVIAMPANR